MLKPLLTLLLASAWTVCAVAASDGRVPLHPEEHYSYIAARFARQFPREHLSRKQMEDSVSCRAWTNYLSSLDYDRVYFVASDIERFEKQRTDLDDQVKRGDLGFAYDVFEVFVSRVRERVQFVGQVLDKGFDLERDESFLWKRKDAPWARDQAELDEIWRKKIKSEFIQRRVQRELAEEDKDKKEESPEPDVAPDADAEDEGLNARDERLTPEAFIRKRYEHILTVLNDSDAEWVLQKYLNAFAAAYDPHSSYLSASSLEDFDIEMKLSLVGIGALLRAEEGAAGVVRIIPGGPADKDKQLKPGDKIIAVAQGDEEPVDILHRPLHKIVRLIRGEKGTEVVLTVIPASDPSETTTKEIRLVRDEVKLEEQAATSETREVPDGQGLPRRLGIVKLPAFYASMKAHANDSDYRSSADDVAVVLAQLQSEAVDGIILDLRNNGGGSLLEAVKIAGLFIETGPTVQVRERFGKRIVYDRDPHIAYTAPLLILVNRLSASASEIVTGALQDYGRALVVGDSKTHGKGTVQTIKDLAGDKRFGASKITTASYYRISGGSTQLRGITPNIIMPSPFDQMEIGEDYLPNAIPWSQVDPARYTASADLAPVAAILRHKSEERRHGDPRFDAYFELLNRIEKVQKSKQIPLNIETRKQMARTEKELSDLQTRLAAEQNGAEEGDKDEKSDLVLSEALNILADFVELSEKLSTVAATDETAETE